jgi:hypothetical protein
MIFKKLFSLVTGKGAAFYWTLQGEGGSEKKDGERWQSPEGPRIAPAASRPIWDVSAWQPNRKVRTGQI